MDLSVTALSAIDKLMKPKMSGRVVNPHVVRHRPELLPDFEKMRQAAHPSFKELPGNGPESD